MSAKKTTAAAATPAPTPASVAGSDAAAEPAWIDSADPRKRRVGKIALWVLWLYVAALWLLALDQWFNWGIFGPKIPPVP